MDNTLNTDSIERQNTVSESLMAWVVCLSGGLLFFYEFIQTNIINSISIPLMSTFHINAGQLGHLSSFYFYADAGLLFFAGSLLDRYSTRKLILFAMVLCTIGTFGFGFAGSFLVASIFRFMVGIGGAFCFLGGVRLASRWFPPRRMALITGIIVTMAFTGGWIAQTPATILVNHYGWRHTMFLNGCLGIVLTAWIWFIVKDRPEHHSEKVTEEYMNLKQLGLWKSAGLVLKNRQNWLAGLYTSLLNLPIFLLGAMWGHMYLVQIDHFTPARASLICSMLFLGSILGSPIMGFISDLMKRRRRPMLIGAVLSLLVILPIVYIPNLSFGILSTLFFLLGLITCTQVIGYPVAAEHNPSMLTGTAVSIVSMTCLLGGAFGLPFSGWLLDLGGHTMVNGTPVYTISAYHHAMLIMPIAFVVAFFVAGCVKETHCKPQT